MISALEADKASWKRENLLVLKLTYCSLCPHCNKISLADKKYPSCTCHDTFDQSIFKNETPSSLQEGEAGRKIKEYGPPSPPKKPTMPWHIIFKLQKILKEARGNKPHTCKGMKIGIISNFSSETMQAIGGWNETLSG